MEAGVLMTAQRAQRYGMELILDLHDCVPVRFTRENIRNFMAALCIDIGMEPCDLHFWDDVGVAPEERQTSAQTQGTSAVQFILTSSITIHTLDQLKKVYLNVFSCKQFDPAVVKITAAHWFGGRIAKELCIDRL